MPPRPRRPPLRAVAAFACVLGLLAVGWLWLRDSRLVAVERVTVTGVSGPDAARVRAALEAVAMDMTTLHVRHRELRTAVEPFPTVLDVRTSSDFPHGLRIEVRERNPVAAVVAGDQRVPVAADGTVMRSTRGDGLPQITAKAAPGGARARDPGVRRALEALRAAPAALRARVRRVYMGPNGLTLPLRAGPTLYLGGSERLRAKWVAAAVVLADPTSAGATYVDLRVPERPAAGGLEQPPDPAKDHPQVPAQAPDPGQPAPAP
ncbi:MAG TPA: cell division protein FtsQ/DivIB [Solirubrobacteraceae bacterium]|nr:cell division protein FtsQ/DivIB [Solirubrobacteraceae bacterium]